MKKKNFQILKNSVINAFKSGAEKVFFTGASLNNSDSMRYTSEILIKEKDYYKKIISEIK